MVLDEPNLLRRRSLITDAHPQIKGLQSVYDVSYVPVLILQLVTYLLLAVAAARLPFWSVGFLLVYPLAGVSFCVALWFGLHSTIHDVTLSRQMRQLLGYLGNVPLVVPMYSLFAMNHIRHHSLHSSVTSKDEVNQQHRNLLAYTPGTFLPNLGSWVKQKHLSPFYLAPVLNQDVSASPILVENLITQLLADTAIVWLLGWKVLFYLGLTFLMIRPYITYMGLEFHPDESTTISKHLPVRDQLSFNSGYHREHHDWPDVASRYYPFVYQVCRGIYEPVESHQIVNLR